MAMIQCKECSKEISDQAETCPNCGCPTNKKSNSENVKTMFCRECGQKIPETSKSCPRCGYEFKSNIENIQQIIILIHTIGKYISQFVCLIIGIIICIYLFRFCLTQYNTIVSNINNIMEIIE